MSISLRGTLLAALLVLAVSLGPSAIAAPSTDGWTMDVACNSGEANLVLIIDNLDELVQFPGEVFRTWADIPLGESGAVLKNLVLGVDGDPVVTLNFKLEAGPSPMVVTFNSVLVSFPTIALAEGTATAAMTLTDNDEDGAVVNGLLAGGKFYEAIYNGSSSFATLIGGPIKANPYDSATAREARPPWQAMGSVSSIESQFKFDLTANDGVSGTSSFRVRPVVPEPGSILCLVTGVLGLVGFARRRRM